MPFDLEFISRPNPVEPNALNHSNLSVHQLNRSSTEHLIPFFSNSRSSQQRNEAAQSSRHPNHASGLNISDVLNKDGCIDERTPPRPDQALFTLPKLPVKPRGTKRHRVPPVLQGLHEPPPAAGLLPSISVEETQVLLPSTRNRQPPLIDPVLEREQQSRPASAIPEQTRKTAEGKQPDRKQVQRNKWTDEETKDLLRGVARFGIGSWKKILLCPDFEFNKRTAVDLKDRFRVCKPTAYGGPRTKKAKREMGANSMARPFADEETARESNDDENRPDNPSEARLATPSKSDNTDQATFTEAGYSNLWKVKRRKRRRFTEEEDAALIRSYQKHGASWTSIQKESIFQARGRTATDLRDRFRTRFPEDYAKAGLAPRPMDFPKPLPRSKAAAEDHNDGPASKGVSTPTKEAVKPSQSSSQMLHSSITPTLYRQHGLPLPCIGEDFLPEFGLPEDDDEGPITLDRSIVDWANSNMPSYRPVPNPESAALPGIDPLITLKLPRPFC